MISPDEVRRKAERWWLDVLRAWLDGTVDGFFPKDVPKIGLDKAADRLARFATIRQEQEVLHQQSKAVRGFGYSLEWTTQGSRMVGQNAYITRIYLDSLADFLALINQQSAFKRFTILASLTLQQVPELETWLRQYPLRLLDNADDWPHWLTICRFFRDTYEPDRYYVRQLPLPVHTKFLEERNSLLLNLLSGIRPALLRPEYKDWRKQLGLRVPEPMIRTRALDDALRLDGKHDDFGLPLSTFAQHIQTARPGGASRIVICENLLNFLTFPQMPNAVAIWSGGGFTIECLADVAWLREKQILYWGDLDAHGFQILNQCRKHFPQTQAILMDQATFDAHDHLTSAGEETKASELPYLTNDERELFNLLKRNNWRIEQERLDEGWVTNTLIRL
ncbi:Wadjet anti-phage system protein JetD domain-containing protein [Spirosoma validum]|uniref:DUF2399 domain-containing protein n=1 Tax=Spirosoma validum TaxID=2771355 RepID=A0A927GGL4_9BACT|nr:DUF3322 and DUF2220 domain-containing protein [Spirosoma validum]MBD2756999.1 DUF2399 domain-containing protein [Spirosoma validum]